MFAVPSTALAQQPEPGGAPAQAERAGGEVNLVIPDLAQVDVGGYNGRTLLMGGMVVAALGIAFGLIILTQLKNLPVHRSMREVSELIYETCKTYLITQGKFLALLEVFIAIIIVLYFGLLCDRLRRHREDAGQQCQQRRSAHRSSQQSSRRSHSSSRP
jgi:K(+)-stimulated pyrophosphate-energized sodium pump